MDAQGHRHLRTALEVVEQVDGDIQLGLSRLEFLDLGGLRLLMAFARSRAAGSQVELVGPASHLREVISLAGWDETPCFGRRPVERVSSVLRHVNRREVPGRRTRIIAEPLWAGTSARRIAEWKRMESGLNVLLADADLG